MNSMTYVFDFLAIRTPQAWLDKAEHSLKVLLIDHAHCEKKAAASALSLIHRYADNLDLLSKMSRLAREELRHFERVLEILAQREIPYQSLSASRYAASLRKHIRSNEPHRLIDQLIIGAFIEARSCERFVSLIPIVDKELSDFYKHLLKSESRHFEDYLQLAECAASESINDRVAFFREVESELICTPDPIFRFHSGV